jgi:Flp pilus assembly protein TadD
VLLRISERDPHNVAVLIDLGIARDLLGQHAEAQRAYRQALAVEPGRTAASVNLALSLALSGDPRQALAILRPIALSPGASPRVRQDLAVALVLAGEDEEAGRVLHTDMPQPEALALVTGYRALR